MSTLRDGDRESVGCKEVAKKRTFSTIAPRIENILNYVGMHVCVCVGGVKKGDEG